MTKSCKIRVLRFTDLCDLQGLVRKSVLGEPAFNVKPYTVVKLLCRRHYRVVIVNICYVVNEIKFERYENSSRN